MDEQRAIELLKRGTTIPDEDVSYDEICEAFEVGIAALDAGIAALEKQTAKRPADIKKMIFAGSDRPRYAYGNCPCCNNYVDTDDNFKYCADCGQKLDWEDEI